MTENENAAETSPETGAAHRSPSWLARLRPRPVVRGLFFVFFIYLCVRMWLFYLCYSRAGFETGYLDVQQIVLDHVSTKGSAA